MSLRVLQTPKNWATLSASQPRKKRTQRTQANTTRVDYLAHNLRSPAVGSGQTNFPPSDQILRETTQFQPNEKQRIIYKI